MINKIRQQQMPSGPRPPVQIVGVITYIKFLSDFS
jgi:hypothetical protein